MAPFFLCIFCLKLVLLVVNKSNQSGLRIAIVGHLVRDRIVALSGNTTDALGGTAYNIAALEAIMKRRQDIPGMQSRQRYQKVV